MPLTVVDALGRTLVVEVRPQRIVSLVPSLTEVLFAFGLDEEIVGVTRFCVEPRDGVAGKTKVGGTKSLDIGKIEKLDPDLVIASAEENSVGGVRRLIEGGLPVFVTLPTSRASRTIQDGEIPFSPGDHTLARVYDDVTGRLKYQFEAETWEPVSETGVPWCFPKS